MIPHFYQPVKLKNHVHPLKKKRFAATATTTQQHNNTTTQQHNNTTTQQHNNTTTQQHNNTTTQQI